MYRSRIPLTRDELNRLRQEFYEKIERGELDIPEAIKAMRKLSRMTQIEFAEHRGVSLKVIQDIERGVGNPTVQSLNKIADIFGVEVGFVRRRRSSRANPGA